MQMLVDLKPGFLRLPGGNALEGDSIPNHFDWKKTVGPLAGRPGHQGPWGYRSSDGMGLLEYLEWAEDMGAEPLLAVYAGYSLDEKHVTPGPDLEPYVQDALDEIEYVTGSADTKWGAQRVKDGHPAPFTLHYVEIGNEDWFDRTPSYQARFAQIYKAIKAKYPQLQCISSIGNEHRKQLVTSVKPDLVDEHYYKSARDFEKMAPTYYEKYPRTPPYIFVGEWAAYEDIIPWDKRSAPLARTPAMKSALGDADWMAAMERNADIVKLQCYAPLLVNENPGASQWRPNLIGYDALNVYGSPSYYAIKMFNLHRGDTILKGTLDAPVTGHTPPPVQYSATQDSKTGMIYLKLVNFKGAAQPVNITLNGVTSISQPASVETLSANSLTDTNTMADPKKIVPVDSTIQDIKPVFTYTLSPYSITIIQMHAM
jgi:alpha-N-arabinofuranosidase